jgi:hypothetical protein
MVAWQCTEDPCQCNLGWAGGDYRDSRTDTDRNAIQADGQATKATNAVVNFYRAREDTIRHVTERRKARRNAQRLGHQLR